MTAIKFAVVAVVFFAVGLFVSIDASGGAYGVSVGTNSSYCSLEWAAGGPAATCETAP